MRASRSRVGSIALRLGLALLVIATLWLGGRAIARALVSDETKIRWRIEDAREGFERTRMDPILALLARDFEDETSGFRRADVRSALASVFFQARDPATREFPYRAEIDEQAIVITKAEAGDRAQVVMPVRIVDTRGGATKTAWDFEFEGELQDGEDGWQLVRAKHRTREGHFRLR